MVNPFGERLFGEQMVSTSSVQPDQHALSLTTAPTSSTMLRGAKPPGWINDIGKAQGIEQAVIMTGIANFHATLLADPLTQFHNINTTRQIADPLTQF